ncbi:MAG: hypothetical protein PHH59_08595 [Methylovulum sp.]|uniref:hypothetical protein n=1 Tax=Methylovulum sp. TaxID=1916980 RepID=UPI0026115710|nr:hypothetical protein [Methylovulum sp.]MDD2724060.1 hypothetical protein [Methylovulum sp.]MDD5123834.1 hypothetical protein [Methylovulum sp.]
MSHAPKPVVIDNATGHILADDDQEQISETSAEADQATTELFGSEDNAPKTAGVIAHFVESYSRNKNTLPIEAWLEQTFSEYPDLWADAAERHATALQIIEKIEQNNQIKADLYAHLDKGKSRESWLAKKIEQGASSGGAAEVGTYAQSIDNVLEQANRKNWDAVIRKDGFTISQNGNLDGFIAEHHHANTFNMDAAAKGSLYRAKVLEPQPGEAYRKNSMDIGIYDADGKLVRRYQAKYGSDADATIKLFKKGDYRGQRKLVPEGHGDTGIAEVIEIDGVSSKPLSKEEAKVLQDQAQQEAEIKQYDWNDTNRLTIAKEIGRKAVIAAAFNAGFQGARILGRRAWNALTGKENRPASEDMQEFFNASLQSAGNVGVQVAVSGALVVAAKSGWLKILQNTPAGQIANIAYIGLENAKCLYKLAKGELNPLEAIDAMGNVTCTAVGGLAGSVKGGVVGFALGGPVGAFVGAVAGGIAGSAVGDVLHKGAKAVAKTAAKIAESAWEGTKTVAKNVFNTLTFGLFS